MIVIIATPFLLTNLDQGQMHAEHCTSFLGRNR